MQNNKWTHNEEKDLVLKLRSGTQMKNIAESSGRSYGAIKERLKKIIFENIKNIDNNDEVQKVASYLNLDSKLIKNYYIAYEGRLKEQSKHPKQEQPKQDQPKQEQSKQEQSKQPKQEQPKQEQPKQDQPKQEQPKQDQPTQSGGTNMTVKKQNEVLEDIIKNHDLKKKIGKLIKTKQLDKTSKEVLKKIYF